MMVHFVGAGPGDPELLTVKAARLLREAKICIFAGSLVNPRVLDLLPNFCKQHNSANMTLEQILQIYKESSNSNTDVVRLHSGDPSIYGAIREQMNGLDALGIKYDVTPGISAFQAGSAALCVELTIPEKNQTIILSRIGNNTVVPEYQHLSQLARIKATLCLYLSIQKISDVTRELIPNYGTDCPVAVVEKASWPEQRIVRGTLLNIAEKAQAIGIKSPAIIIVGDALANNNQAKSRLYDSSFNHKFRRATT